MLNLHAPIINNTLNNTIYEELPEEWLNRLSPNATGAIVNGYYNAGILTLNMSDFNDNGFYDEVIKNNFGQYCEDLYLQLKPIIQKCLRRMFLGFSSYLSEYELILFMEGREGDDLEPVKFSIKVI